MRRLLAGVVLLISGCSGPILANATPPAAAPAAPSAVPSRPADPVPIVLPRDDGPHNRLTEWWYYTGHLRSTSGGRWGFEMVVFRAERGSFPVSWASHLALTDEAAGTFRYDQRSVVGPQVDQSARLGGPGFALAIGGDPTGSGRQAGAASPQAGAPSPQAGAPQPWVMTGSGGHDHLAADSSTADFGLGLDLATSRPAALHDRDGFVDFGPAGGSYYYSRTRLTAGGSLRVGARTVQVNGSAWFDHQWGDFIAVGGGGWDWFAVNLADGTDLTLSLVRDGAGGYPLVYGTVVDPDGAVRHLDRDAFSVATTGSWTSPRSGATYPAGWRISIPGEGLSIDLRPTVADQELDTRATTGVIYWEGSQVVQASRRGQPLGGEAYVELTGYGPGNGRPTASPGERSAPPTASPGASAGLP